MNDCLSRVTFSVERERSRALAENDAMTKYRDTYACLDHHTFVAMFLLFSWLVMLLGCFVGCFDAFPFFNWTSILRCDAGPFWLGLLCLMPPQDLVQRKHTKQTDAPREQPLRDSTDAASFLHHRVFLSLSLFVHHFCTRQYVSMTRARASNQMPRSLANYTIHLLPK